MYKNDFEGTVGSNTICHGTQGESHPPMHLVISRQTSVLAVNPAVAHELAPAPFSHTSGTLGRHYLRQLPMDERACVKVQMFTRKIGDTVRVKILVWTHYSGRQLVKNEEGDSYFKCKHSNAKLERI